MQQTQKERFWAFYDRHAPKLNKVVNPLDLLPHVGPLIPMEAQEKITAELEKHGRGYTVPTFIKALRHRDNSHVAFFTALEQQEGLQEVISFIQTEFIDKEMNHWSGQMECKPEQLTSCQPNDIR